MSTNSENENKDPEATGPAVSESAVDDGESDNEDSTSGNTNMALITGFGLALLVVIVMLASNSQPQSLAQTANSAEVPSTPTAVADQDDPQRLDPATAARVMTSAAGDSQASMPAASAAATGSGTIERKGEGRHFYTTIKIPPGAETLYLSGSGARRQPDGSMGDMATQTIDTFSRFKETLEAEGWSMSDVVQVRAFAVADEFGLLDFAGFNRAYRQFFGTEENPMKPVRSFVEIAGLVVPGWLVEIEIRAARMPE